MFGPGIAPACHVDGKLWSKLTNEQRQFFVLWEQDAPDDLPWPVAEHRFARVQLGRLWQFDVAWPYARAALEFEGGIFAKKGGRKCPTCGLVEAGAHGKASGILRDIAKYNAAHILGWFVFRVPVPLFKQYPGVILDMAVDLVQARYRQHQAHEALARILGRLEREAPPDMNGQITEAIGYLDALGLRPYSTQRHWAAKDWIRPSRKGYRKRKR